MPPLPPIPKKVFPLIIAAALGLVATYLVNSYIQSQTEAAKKNLVANQQNATTVVIAKQDIAAGTTLTEAMLKEVPTYKNMLQPRAATSIDRVVNKVNIAPISKGEQVLLTKLALSNQELSLSNKVPRGKRAITVPVDNIASVGGMIRPGDHVDVMGMVPVPSKDASGKDVMQMTSMPLFQDVLVLAVGREFTNIPGQAREEKTTYPVITFSLSPEEANLIAFVQQQGSIRLILRSPEDTSKQVAQPATWDALFRTIRPDWFQKPDALEQEQEALKPAQKTVEIYRGLTKEVKTLDLK